jgi:outer membrane receptor protein involved in Fe transport
MAVAAVQGAAAVEQKRSYNLPSGDAATTLNQFAGASGQQIIFMMEKVKGERTNAVAGDYAAREALDRMLAGTGLSAARDPATGAFVVSPKRTAEVVPRTGEVGPVSDPQPKPPAKAMSSKTRTVFAVLASWLLASTAAEAQTHSIKGQFRQPPGGSSLEGIVVTIAEPGATATVDRSGNFAFTSVGPGTYTLIATGKGYASLKITDVVVSAGKTLTLPLEEMPAIIEGSRTVSAKSESGQGLQKLPSFFVSSSNFRSFEGEGGNMDNPRSSNDVQAYTIINAEAMEQTNRLNVGDFLQDQVTQSSTGLQNSQSPAILGDGMAGSSQVDLRGFGNLQTLILINGTRAVSGVFKGVELQANLNQIPIAAIDRVEILPSSASGIYGSSAVGGAINIILKKNFSGGQIQASYQNTLEGDNPTRTLSVYDSFFLKRTRVSFMLSYSDGKVPLRQDRPFLKDYFNRRVANAPEQFYTANAPFASGALPNIALNPAVVNGYRNPSSAALTFKNGVSLGSTLTYVPAGTTLRTDSATLNAGLAANAGKQNFDEAPSIYRGSQMPLLKAPQNQAIQTTISHKFNDMVDVYADIGINQQKTHNTSLPLINGHLRITTLHLSVPGDAPNNPFQQNVFVSHPRRADAATTMETTAISRLLKGGVHLHLPNGWEALAEYSYSNVSTLIQYGLMDFNNTTNFGAQAPLLYKGLYNPFVDSLLNEQKIEQYYGTWKFWNPTQLMDFNARANGPILNLPAGDVRLTAGVEARLNLMDENYQIGEFPSLLGDNGAPNVSNTPAHQYVGGQKQGVKSLFLEARVPVVSARNQVPLVQGLEFQLAGRIERFTVITNPNSINIYPYRLNVATRITNTTKEGRNWFKYSSTNPTLGLKYTPVNGLVLRGSYANGFVPPTYVQFGSTISGESESDTALTLDPKTGETYRVPVLKGNAANPDLQPQTAENFGWGVVYQPTSGRFKGLRISLDFYKNFQKGAIFRPSYLQALASPDLAYLIPRGPDGRVVSYTQQFVNGEKQYSSGYDVTINYRRKIDGVGTITLNTGGTVINHLMLPFVYKGPLVEYSGFPNSGGAVKTKANASVNWLIGKHWSLGWNSRYWAAYKQQGSPSDPQYNGATTYTPQTVQLRAQGGAAAINGIKIPSQMYHNIFASYVFGDSPKLPFMARTTIQVGLDNIFNKLPPFDAHARYAPFYYSPYGNLLLRTYLLKVKRDF